MITELERKVISLSYKLGLSHISSCISTVNPLDQIYAMKKKEDIVVLDNGHAHLAHALVMEKYGYIPSAEENIKRHGIHCERAGGCDVSTGSLGCGITIAVGMALANRERTVYVIGSDGGLNEGSWYESMRIAADNRLENLRIAIIANGYGANCHIDIDDLDNRVNVFYPTMVVRTNMFSYPEYLQGQSGHYHVLTKEQYEEIIR